MKLYNWNEVAEEELNPRIRRKMFHTATMTVSKLRLLRGVLVPTHSHINEQISSVEEGALRFVTPTGEVVVKAGESLCIPPNLPHSVESLEDCVVVDIFSPVREDWVRGDDAYLRS
jgi:quercetin dioxygenase-like cupin family protein